MVFLYWKSSCRGFDSLPRHHLFPFTRLLSNHTDLPLPVGPPLKWIIYPFMTLIGSFVSGAGGRYPSELISSPLAFMDGGLFVCWFPVEMLYVAAGLRGAEYRKYTTLLCSQGLPCMMQGVINTGILRLPPTTPHFCGLLRGNDYW